MIQNMNAETQQRTAVIGDVHGCARELARLIRNMQPTRIILVGDLFTKGPDPAGVWELIQTYDIQAVMGNHDAWLLKILDGEVRPKPKHRKVLDIMAQKAPGWEDWLRALPLHREEQGFIIVHAGLNPNGSLADTTEEMALLMRHWPIGKLSAPHWHELYTGEKGVIFGHDARGGLVYTRKHDRPYIIGLDTGCVYGKKLTGYLIETDELFQVSAAQVYQQIYCF